MTGIDRQISMVKVHIERPDGSYFDAECAYPDDGVSLDFCHTMTTGKLTLSFHADLSNFMIDQVNKLPQNNVEGKINPWRRNEQRGHGHE